MTEKPANIVRRRLMEAGYEDADDLPLLGMEDIQYLMKFVYKSNVLGRTVRLFLFINHKITIQLIRDISA